MMNTQEQLLNSAPTRFALSMLVSLQPGGAAGLMQFRQQASELFTKYDLRIERQFKISGKGQLVGQNQWEAPDLIQIISLPSAEHFKAYVSDPQYIALAKSRDESIRRMTVMVGIPLDISDVATQGSGEESTRLYGVGLVRFKLGGSDGLDQFNRRARELFTRHGMHLESAMDVKQTLTPVGETQGIQVDRMVVFFLDEPSALKAYASDPEYRALAPLRDEGLYAYDFFLGSSVSTLADD